MRWYKNIKKKYVQNAVRRALEINGFREEKNGDMTKWETGCMFSNADIKQYTKLEDFYTDYPFYNPEYYG
jgi:Arc/MetJ family transcription regulator